MKHKYSIEMFKIWENEEHPRWGTDIRYYMVKKDLESEDLKDVPGKRKNAKYLGVEGRKSSSSYYGYGTEKSMLHSLIPFL